MPPRSAGSGVPRSRPTFWRCMPTCCRPARSSSGAGRARRGCGIRRIRSAGFADVTKAYQLYCTGHAFLPDGRLLIVGGAIQTSAEAEGRRQGHHLQPRHQRLQPDRGGDGPGPVLPDAHRAAERDRSWRCRDRTRPGRRDDPRDLRWRELAAGSPARRSRFRRPITPRCSSRPTGRCSSPASRPRRATCRSEGTGRLDGGGRPARWPIGPWAPR